jgi:NAD dependent epimerase/dehydratase family enzyme
VVVLTRGRPRRGAGVRFVRWDGVTVGPWAAEVDGAAAVVHLAGKRVDCRPTRRSVDELIRSRVEPVRAMGEALARCVEPPGAWVQLSTMAIYGDAGETVLDERVPPSGIGPRQMVTVALAWETAFRQASDGVPRRVLLRAGIALGGDGDPATARLRQLAILGLAGPVAGGRQWVSWPALDDLLRILVRAVDDDGMRGLYLATSPAPVRNAEIMRTCRRLSTAAGACPRRQPSRPWGHGSWAPTRPWRSSAAAAIRAASSTRDSGSPPPASRKRRVRRRSRRRRGGGRGGPAARRRRAAWGAIPPPGLMRWPTVRPPAAPT